MIKFLKNLVKGRKKKCNISCSFYDGETVIYGEDKVEIQGVWEDWATIKFNDGCTINVGTDELSKLVV